MALFSEEYYTINKINVESDFSYIKIASLLNDNEIFHEICEGLGFVGVTKKQGNVFLITKKKTLIPYNEIIQALD